MRRFDPRLPRAFTLLEMLTVIAIITIIVGLLLPVFGAFARERERTKAEHDLSQAAISIKMLKDDYDYDDVLGLDDKGVIVNTLDEAIFKELDPTNAEWRDTYVPYLNSRKKQYFPLKAHHVKKIGADMKAVDPWGQPYQYRVVEETIDTDTYFVEKIWSYGPDKTDATEDDIVREVLRRLKPAP